MSTHNIIEIDRSNLSREYDPKIFSVDSYQVKEFYDHNKLPRSKLARY